MSEPSILLAYHSGEGQTAKIAERIEATLVAAGASVTRVVAEQAPAPAGFDGVIAGDSIHAGRHSKELSGYVEAHAGALNRLPVGLFQVSLTSANPDEEHSAIATGMVKDFLEATELDPDIVGLFAGALAYTRYGFFKRNLLKRITAKEGGDTDTSVDHEYTDWDAVEHFATDVLALVRTSAEG
ncbi:MAG: protoporphyrinogen oxidase [Acidimicrobiales bacterium]|nr:protoporphyrinogen oxidase [Acidimicrobiales bacterium]